MKKTGFVLLLLLLGSGVSSADIVITNVTAQQRPGTKLVDITYDLSSDADTVWIGLRVRDGDTLLPVNSVTGDVGFDVEPGTGKAIVWDAEADWLGHVAGDVTFTVIAEEGAMVHIPGGTNVGTVPDPDGGHTV